MSNLSGTGIIVEGKIVDPNQYPLQTGKSAGLLRLEIYVTVPELKKVISAYQSYYVILVQKKSYNKGPKNKSAAVIIDLMFGLDKYQALLKTPESRFADLTSGKPLVTGYLEPWIPCGPVKDMSGNDVKLTGALCKAGFPVRLWTQQATSLNLPKKKMRTLQTVKFRVQGGTWTFLPQSGLTQSVGTPKTDK